MHCFYHETTDAVAICKSCNRGVCRECAVELKNGIACKNRCEVEVEAVNQIIERGKTAHKETSAAYSRNAIIYLMAAVVFGYWGIKTMDGRPPFGWTMLALALVFLIAAVFHYSISRRVMTSETDKGT